MPEVAGQQRFQLDPGEAHLRSQLHQLLADKLRAVAEPIGEEDDRFAEKQAVLGAAEGEQIDADVAGQLPQGDALRRRGVGDPCPVDVKEEVAPVGGVGDRPHLLGRVDGAKLGRVGDRGDPGLGGVIVADPLPGEGRFEQLRGQLPVGGLDRDQLHPGDPLRGAALVDMEVGGGRADHRLPGLCHGGDRDHVGAAAVEHGEGPGRRPEVLAEALPRSGGPAVGAVRGGVAVIGRRDRLEDLRVGAGVVVAGEAAAGVHWCSDSRWPFIRPPSSEQRKAIASARCSAGVKDA